MQTHTQERMQTHTYMYVYKNVCKHTRKCQKKRLAHLIARNRRRATSAILRIAPALAVRGGERQGVCMGGEARLTRGTCAKKKRTADKAMLQRKTRACKCSCVAACMHAGIRIRACMRAYTRAPTVGGCATIGTEPSCACTAEGSFRKTLSCSVPCGLCSSPIALSTPSS